MHYNRICEIGGPVIAQANGRRKALGRRDQMRQGTLSNERRNASRKTTGDSSGRTQASPSPSPSTPLPSADRVLVPPRGAGHGVLGPRVGQGGFPEGQGVTALCRLRWRAPRALAARPPARPHWPPPRPAAARPRPGARLRVTRAGGRLWALTW